MMKRKTVYVIIIIVGLIAWSPWLTRASAENHVAAPFNKSWEYIADGCGTDCKGCGAVRSQRVPLGMLVTLEYGCGMIPEDTSEYHELALAFFSPVGTVHGLPKP